MGSRHGSDPMSDAIAIVGGGLAGLAAALRLAESGRRVEVLETRPRLGGRATSFEDPRSGRILDNCQHVVLGCCTNLLDFYERTGVLDEIEWHRTFFWANPPHEPDRLSMAPLPAPLHLAASFLRQRRITVAEKFRLASAIAAILRMGRSRRVREGDRVFLDVLSELGQTQREIEQFWSPIIASACNLDVDEVASSHAMQVIQEGFLAHPFAAAMGLARHSLLSLYEPARRCIEAAGGTIRTGVSAKSLAFDGRRVTAVVTDEGAVPASAVVSAVPPDRLAKLCSATLRSADPRLARLEEIGFSPILGVHLFFDEPFTDLPHLVLPGRGTQWLFMKGRDESGRHHAHAVISAAAAWMPLSEAEIAAKVMEDVRWAFPRRRIPDPVEVRSVKEKRATFAAVPGIDRLRPMARAGVLGGAENLFLAGDWCATGWPATMEGAVRSGYAAAAAILGEEAASAQVGVVDDLPTARLAALAGLSR